MICGEMKSGFFRVVCDICFSGFSSDNDEAPTFEPVVE